MSPSATQSCVWTSCGDKLYVQVVCEYSKLCVDKLRGDKLYVSKFVCE